MPGFTLKILVFRLKVNLHRIKLFLKKLLWAIRFRTEGLITLMKIQENKPIYIYITLYHI